MYDIIVELIKYCLRAIVTIGDKISSPDIRGLLLVYIPGMALMIWWSITYHVKDVDQSWSALCAMLVDKIDDLIPEYDQAITDYCKHVRESIENDVDLCNLAASIPDMGMAEADFISEAIADDEYVWQLIIQLKHLKEVNKNGNRNTS